MDLEVEEGIGGGGALGPQFLIPAENEFTALLILARAWAGEGMECGGKRSATPLWLSPGARCGRAIVRSLMEYMNGRGCDNSLSY
ncbi:MAG: hypothetical protein NTW21_43680, partial [Verrucomicrobia bacterium]|nr:hypothetical protein [Verrucomicrobiota bacterium]